MKLPRALAAAALATAAAVAFAATLPTMSADAAAPTTGSPRRCCADDFPRCCSVREGHHGTRRATAARTPCLCHQPGEQGLRQDVRAGLAGAVPERRSCAPRASCCRSTTASRTTACRTTSRRSAARARTRRRRATATSSATSSGSGTAAPGQAVGQRLRLSQDGAHGRQPAHQARADVEGLHGEHALALPPPRAEQPPTAPRRRRSATSTPPGTTRSSTSTRSSTRRQCAKRDVVLKKLPKDLAKVRDDART